jgi:hypothetical protein
MAESEYPKPNNCFFRSVARVCLGTFLLQVIGTPWAQASTSLSSREAARASLLSGFSQEVSKSLGGAGVSEFFYRSDSDDILVPVYLLGAVGKPGLYHVPVKSQLVTVLSIAGGLSPEADSDSVMLKDNRAGKTTIFQMADIMQPQEGLGPTLLGNEVIFVEKSKPIVSNNTLLLLTVISTVAGITLSALVLKNELKK